MTVRSEVPAEFLDQPPSVTEPQLRFLMSLLQERDLSASDKVDAVPGTDEYDQVVNSMIEKAKTLDKRTASQWIGRLTDLPRLSMPGNALPGEDVIPAGRYAVENDDGELRFYHLWRHPRNSGFIKLYVAHGPDDSEVPFRSALSIVKKIIEAGPRECALRYGAEIKACSRCGIRLTNRLSRELNIGPICGGHWYEDDDWKRVKKEARASLRERGLDPNENIDD